MMRYIKLLPIFFVLAVIGLIVSCEDDKTTNPQDQIPTIPPQSSFVINFNEFPDTSSVNPVNPNLTTRNWTWAAGNVEFLQSILNVTLAIPVAAFLESFNHQPTQQPDGSWLWQYTVTFQEETYTAKLYGNIVTDGVNWQMLLSKSGSYQDFEWFTGFSNLPATEGTWMLNRDPLTPSPFLSIEWMRNIQDEIANVKYTLMSTSVLQQGGYIYFGKTNEVPLNRFYQIFKADADNLIDIKWSYESHFGRVKDSVYFQDSNWHCWDDRLEDTECPE